MKQVLEDYFIKSIKDALFCKKYKYSISEKVSEECKFRLKEILHTICSDFAEKETDRIVKSENEFAFIFPDLITEEERTKAQKHMVKNLESGKYPVLFNKMKNTSDFFVRNCNVLADRINEQKEEIERVLLNGNIFTEISDFKFVSRDSLYGSSAVNIIVVTNAGKFFYKPHDCTLDYCFHALNTRYFSNNFKTPRVVKNSYDYGFCEFMYNKVAENNSDAAKFYENMGALSAVLCFTQGQDCHIKNVFANGIYPVPIDLEMIVFPYMPLAEKDSVKEDFGIDDFRLSVAIRGILPCQSLEGKEYSPLLDTPDENFNCSPIVDRKRVTVFDYEAEYKEGFEKTFRYCLSIKDKFIRWFEELGEAHIRHIYGQKQLHSKVSDYLNSYSALSSEEAQQKAIKRIETSIIGTIEDERIRRECVRIDSLGELPYFYSQMRSKDLFGSFGMVIKDYYEKTPIESIIETIEYQDDKFLDFNLRLIEQALSDCIVKTKDTKAILKEKVSVRQRIDNLFLRIKDHFIQTPSGEKVLIAQIKGNPLSALPNLGGDGKMGIALFLKYYAFCFKDSEYAKEASSLASFLIDEVAEAAPYIDNTSPLGDCEGLAGTLKCALLINRIEKNPKVDYLITEICKKIDCYDLNRPLACDKYSGLAGAITVFCSFQELPEREKTVRRLANRLLELKTFKYKNMLLWDTVFQKKVLSGAAHGMIGLFQALFLAYQLTGKQEYKNAAMDAYKFETDCFSKELGTWPDFRDSQEPKNTMHGFCSGAPGIGSILLSLYKYKESIPNYDKNLERAIISCINQNIMYRDHICCGNGAVFDFMLDLFNASGKEKYYNKAQSLLLPETEYAFLPSDHKNSFVIGLYFGAAGVGYELLRLLKPAELPSVLV